MRKEALQMSNMNRKATHSSQTTVSRSRKEIEIQTQDWDVREESTQTMKETATEIRPAKSIVIGLRGDTNLPVEHILLDDLLLSI